jgi:hypothetical protein
MDVFEVESSEYGIASATSSPEVQGHSAMFKAFRDFVPPSAQNLGGYH